MNFLISFFFNKYHMQLINFLYLSNERLSLSLPPSRTYLAAYQVRKERDTSGICLCKLGSYNKGGEGPS